MKHFSKNFCAILLLLVSIGNAQTTFISSKSPSSFPDFGKSGVVEEVPCGQVVITQSSGLLICGSSDGILPSTCTACGVSTTSSYLNGPNATVTLLTSCFTLTFPTDPSHPNRNITVNVTAGPATDKYGNACTNQSSISVSLTPNVPVQFEVYLDSYGCCRVRTR